MDQPRAAFYPKTVPPQKMPRAIAYAGFFYRFGAFLVDSILFGVFFWIVSQVIGLFMGTRITRIMQLSGFNPGSPGIPPELIGSLVDLFFVTLVVNLVLSWLYFASFESSSMQATPGKRLLGMKVTDLDGDPISFGMATGRFLGKIISTLILLIGYLMAAFTAKRQALHDLIAGTVVIMRQE